MVSTIRTGYTLPWYVKSNIAFFCARVFPLRHLLHLLLALAALTARAQDTEWRVPFITTPDEVERLRRASQAAAAVLAEVGRLVAPGVKTDDLDAACHEAIIARFSPIGK